MLKSWYLQNFKPILDSGELKLAPVTVLVGRNSSGKSSLIQSILMIAQTLSNRVLDRALLPNGSIVQLKTFEDILSEQTDLRTLEVGFLLEIDKEEQRVPTSTRTRVVDGRVISRSRTDIESVKITSQFQSANINGTSTSAIEASKVNIESVLLDVQTLQLPSFLQDDLSLHDKTGKRLDFSLTIKRLLPEELTNFLKDVSEDLRHVPYTNNEPNYLGTFTSKNELANLQFPEPSLITFSHFLPTRLTGKYIIEERRKLQLRRAVELALRYPGSNLLLLKDLTEGVLDPSTVLQDSLREAILDFCKEKEEDIPKTFSGRTLYDLISWYRSLKLNLEKDSVTNGLVEIVARGILEQSSKLEKDAKALEIVSNNFFVENLTSAVEQTIRFFASKIRYLGPLRADPQEAQKFPSSSELDDVGAKGEHAAAIYDANQNAIIQWYNPLKNITEKSALKFALDTWIRYLGVANEIKTQEAGLSGISWQVIHMEGHKALPLSAVGVGVSQILPILVMGLLAPDNTLLIVEQPELHLHPSVQARLGDFFMGLAKCSKQCLIETHSENLVSQLRVHIVEADEPENADCLIYFVDQDEQGATQFTPIKISPNGNILNWPHGFVDETILQEDRITAAVLKKRAKKSNNG
jgi:predicted ATPase